MKKLLHERLREWAVWDEQKNGSVLKEWTHYFGGTISQPPEDSKIFQHLADEIERYYIPRPRFADGTPIDWYDDALIDWGDGCKWGFNAIDDLGTPLAIGDCEIGAKAKMQDGYVIRRESKVLDADGVEINVGDRVWHLNGTEYTVTDVHSEGVDVRKPDNPLSLGGFLATQLTHKKPDSLEKLHEDMEDYLVACLEEWEELRAYADRLSALIERGDQ